MCAWRCSSATALRPDLGADGHLQARRPPAHTTPDWTWRDQRRVMVLDTLYNLEEFHFSGKCGPALCHYLVCTAPALVLYFILFYVLILREEHRFVVLFTGAYIS